MIFIIRDIILRKLIINFFYRFIFLNINYFFLSSRVRIKNSKVIKGNNIKRSNNYCIFATYIKNEDSILILEKALKIFSKKNINVLIINDGFLEKKLENKLKKNVLFLIQRKQLGFDMGSYKLGTNFLATYLEKKNLSTVFYINDSTFVLEKNLEITINKMLKLHRKYKVVGLTANRRPKYHIQSVFFSLKGEVFYSHLWQKFWKKYKAKSNRVHTVINGELKITEVLLKLTSSINILFSYQKIKKSINTKDLSLSKLSLGLQKNHKHFLTLYKEKNRFFIYKYLDGSASPISDANIYNIYIYFILENKFNFPFIKKDLILNDQIFMGDLKNLLYKLNIDINYRSLMFNHFMKSDNFYWSNLSLLRDAAFDFKFIKKYILHEIRYIW